MTQAEQMRMDELTQKFIDSTTGGPNLTSKEMVELTKIKHKFKMKTNVALRKQVEFERRVQN